MIQTIGLNLRRSAGARGRYLKKQGIFGGIGDNVRFQPRVIPLYPELIRLHNNITIGAGVRFVTHDAIHTVLSRIGDEKFPEMVGCIEICDNVFVGTDTTIMSNVRIGNNVIIGANSLVNKDCEPNSVYAGVPAKRIGSFEDLVAKRRLGDYPTVMHNQNISDKEIENAWHFFYKRRDTNSEEKCLN